MSTKVITGKCRASFVHIFEPKSVNGSDPKYSMSLIIPKSDSKTIGAIKPAIDEAIQNGISGLSATKEAVQAAGIGAVGTWTSPQDREENPVLIREVNGLRIAFLAFTKGMNNMRLPDGAEYCVDLLYSDYDSNLCHDGGHYATGVTFIRRPDGWERQEYTSGDYCPYCGSFDCCGSCEEVLAAEAERLTDSEGMDEVNRYRGQADTAIMYQPA